MEDVFNVLTFPLTPPPFSLFQRCRPLSPRRCRYGEPSAQTLNALYLSSRGQKGRKFCLFTKEDIYSRTHLHVERDSFRGGCRRPAAAAAAVSEEGVLWAVVGAESLKRLARRGRDRTVVSRQQQRRVRSLCRSESQTYIRSFGSQSIGGGREVALQKFCGEGVKT